MHAHAKAVTPDDILNFPEPSRYIYAGTGGDVRLLTIGGEIVVFVAMPSGSST